MVATAVAAAFIIATGALFAALVSVSTSHTSSDLSADAAREAKAVAECVNNILGDRGPLTQQDTDATRAVINSLGPVLADALGHASKTQALADVNELVRAVANYRVTTDHTTAARHAHPLGRC